MNKNTPIDISEIGMNGYVSASNVMTLRRTVFADGVVSAEELDALFQLGERAPDGDREWSDYFAEAAADFYLREEEPNGYLTDAEFHTLRERITRDGEKASTLELHLLVKLMETAVETPQPMAAFTATQIKRHIVEKTGGAFVSPDDVHLMSRFIFAAGGDGNIAVTKQEAELLFDINDAVARSAASDKTAPAWADFFKKAIANHLMAHIGASPLGRKEALQLHADFKDDSARAPISGPRDLWARLRLSLSSTSKNLEKRHGALNKARAAEAAVAEKITAEEADWLADRIGRDGDFDERERALLDHMRSLDADLPPKLKALVDKAA